jgi:hypothetical protein
VAVSPGIYVRISLHALSGNGPSGSFITPHTSVSTYVSRAGLPIKEFGRNLIMGPLIKSMCLAVSACAQNFTVRSFAAAVVVKTDTGHSMDGLAKQGGCYPLDRLLLMLVTSSTSSAATTLKRHASLSFASEGAIFLPVSVFSP